MNPQSLGETPACGQVLKIICLAIDILGRYASEHKSFYMRLISIPQSSCPPRHNSAFMLTMALSYLKKISSSPLSTWINTASTMPLPRMIPTHTNARADLQLASNKHRKATSSFEAIVVFNQPISRTNGEAILRAIIRKHLLGVCGSRSLQAHVLHTRLSTLWATAAWSCYVSPRDHISNGI